MTDSTQNQGEGDRASARRYNQAATKTAREMRAEDFSAPRPLTPTERDELRRAEAIGKARAKAEDPLVARDPHGRRPPGPQAKPR